VPIALAIILLAAMPARAQPLTRCAVCHLAKLGQVAGDEHVAEWQSSAHATHAVGCHDCHGGDPWGIEPADAHRDMRGPSQLLSPVNRLNVADTCARCHPRNANAYATTLHATLAEIGDRRAPVCTTCHGVMSARIPSPEDLEARCASCHPPGSPRAAYPARMRAAVEALMTEQARAAALNDRAERLDDYAARVDALATLLAVRQTLSDAITSVHRLDPSATMEQMATVRRQLDSISQQFPPQVFRR